MDIETGIIFKNVFGCSAALFISPTNYKYVWPVCHCFFVVLKLDIAVGLYLGIYYLSSKLSATCVKILLGASRCVLFLNVF